MDRQNEQPTHTKSSHFLDDWTQTIWKLNYNHGLKNMLRVRLHYIMLRTPSKDTFQLWQQHICYFTINDNYS